MFRSKPIGWITAGTLFCVAGVALACRLRDGKEATAEANAAACPTASAEAKDESPAPAKPADPSTEPEKKEKASPLFSDKSPMVGESVAPAASPSKEAKTDERPAEALTPPPPPAAVGVESPPPLTPSSPPAPPETVTTPVPEVAKVPASEPAAPPKANLLSPETTAEAAPIRPVSGKEVAVPTPPAEPKSAPPSPPSESAPPAATIPMKDEVTSPSSPPPITPRSAGVAVIPAPAPSTPSPPSSPLSVLADTPSVSLTSPTTTLSKVRSKGETLREIAVRTLNNGERWTEIYRLNPDLQPDLIVPSGKEVHLPADAKLDTAPDGSQSESEHTGVKPSVTAVRPLPVVRPRQLQASEKSLAPLTGTYSCQLENRSLVLPKEAVDQLGKVDTMLLTPGPDRCLWLGTQASVARVLERVEKSGAADREVQTFRRLYFAQTEKASVNEAGKMMIPEKLAEYAGLGKEVVLVGIDDHFELWDAAHWQRYSQQKEPSLKP